MGVSAFATFRLSADEGGAAQRGARCLSVGVLMSCATYPTAKLRALLPQVPLLTRLVQDIAHGAPMPLLATYEALAPPSLQDELHYDPASHFTAVHRFLGPLILPLIKFLHVPRRLLLYAPAPLERAAIVAFFCAELVHAAYAHALNVPGGVFVLGTVTLHDMHRLRSETTSAVIAWTSDRILLDHTDLYDACVDLSSFMRDGQEARRCSRLAHVVDRRTRQRSVLTWNARELSLFFEMDKQENEYARLLEEEALREQSPSPERLTRAARWTYQGQDARCYVLGYVIVWVAYVRFWLSEWWIIRSQLHVAVPYALVVPLGLRSDGGLGAGLVDLSEDVSDDEADDDDHDDINTDHSDTDNIDIDNDIDDDDAKVAVARDDALTAGLLQPSQPSTTDTVLPTPNEAASPARPDPLVAALGLAPADDHDSSHSHAEEHRASLSHFSLRSSHRSSTTQVILPAHPRYEPAQAPQLPRETMLSLYLFTLWSSYVRAMHIQLSSYLADKAADVPPAVETSSLLRGREVKLPASDWAQFGLDARSAIDRDLVQSLLDRHACRLRILHWWHWLG